MAGEITLSNRALNRALLARQMLLARETLGVEAVVEKLVGLQAQLARPPFVGLWTRIKDFRRESLLEALASRQVVRATMMRGTLHMVTTSDYLAFRAALQPMLTGAGRSIVRARGTVLDEAAIVEAAAQCFKERPQTFTEVRATLAARFPEIDERSMGYLARTAIPLVMVPDDSEYGFTGSTFFSAEAWIEQPVPSTDRLPELILRYLAGFGPATVRDAQAWSGCAKLDSVFETLRPQLTVFRDEYKRELFDLPEAPRPPENTAAPVRFLPAFDNVILAHADRTRIIRDEYRARVSTKNLQILPTFLVDGFVAGTWEIECRKGIATINISPFEPISAANTRKLTAEAEKLAPLMGAASTRVQVGVS